MKLIKITTLLILLASQSYAQSKTNISGSISYVCTRELGEYKQEANNTSNSNKHLSRWLFLFNNGEANHFYINTGNNGITGRSGDSIILLKKADGVAQPPFLKQYQNFATKVIISKERAVKTLYLVADTIITIPWKLSKNTKKIQNIECFSAQAEYRGRVWTAWYAPSIPILSGPWKLYGLPGMILEAEDREGLIRFECESIVIPALNNTKIETSEFFDINEKHISTKEYAILAKKNIENYEKMNTTVTDKNGNMSKSSMGVQNIEIFDFEKNLTMKRFQQKLSDIPKK